MFSHKFFKMCAFCVNRHMILALPLPKLTLEVSQTPILAKWRELSISFNLSNKRNETQANDNLLIDCIHMERQAILKQADTWIIHY